MAREVNPRSQPVETMRAADADRHQIADHLKAALDEGRLTLGEYDDRVRQAYAARTYAELMVLVTDLPAPGLSASEVSHFLGFSNPAAYHRAFKRWTGTTPGAYAKGRSGSQDGGGVS